jgi:hypothetical protein
MIRKPVEDATRYDRVWNEMVLPLRDAYVSGREVSKPPGSHGRGD